MRRSRGILSSIIVLVTAPPCFGFSTDLARNVVSGLTNVVNFGKPPPPPVPARLAERVAPEALLEGLRQDFVEREYLWSGKITPELYGETCEFSDPTLSFRGLQTFLENIRNLDPILETYVPADSRRVVLKSIKLNKEAQQIVAQWRMQGDLKLPWRPRIDLDGRTAFSYDPSVDGGRISRYDETWEIAPGEALLQILQPRFAEESSAQQPEHWEGRLDGRPPPIPAPESCARPGDGPLPVVILPGFGNAAEDYSTPLQQDEAVGLVAALGRRGFSDVTVVPVERFDWLRVFAGGLVDVAGFWANNATASGPSFKWYLDRVRCTVEDAQQRAVLAGADGAEGAAGRVVLLGRKSHHDARSFPFLSFLS